MSGRPYVMTMVIITRDSLTIKAFEQDGKNVLEEIRRKGEVLDCVKGNFEDESVILDELFVALEELKRASFEVMGTLSPI